MTALDAVRARRQGLVRGRQRVERVVRMVAEALQGEDQEGEYAPGGVGVQASGVQAQGQGRVEGEKQERQGSVQMPGGMVGSIGVAAGDAPRWRSIRRRVVGRIRRSLPEGYGVVQIAEGMQPSIAEVVPEIPVAAPVPVAAAA